MVTMVTDVLFLVSKKKKISMNLKTGLYVIYLTICVFI